MSVLHHEHATNMGTVNIAQVAVFCHKPYVKGSRATKSRNNLMVT